MVFIETPTNPLLHVLDIESIARSTHLQPGTLLVVDNTFTTPYLQRPLDLDADITVTSLSKYMNGHSDVIMGFVATNCKTVYKKLRTLQTGKFLVICHYFVVRQKTCFSVCSIRIIPKRSNIFFENSLEMRRLLTPRRKIQYAKWKMKINAIFFLNLYGICKMVGLWGAPLCLLRHCGIVLWQASRR